MTAAGIPFRGGGRIVPVVALELAQRGIRDTLISSLR